MKREIIKTADGSTTIHIPEWNEQYHSKHGAIQEAQHVFIKHGLHYLCTATHITSPLNEVSILEIGFGTGLNAFITFLESEKLNIVVNYVGVEGYPVAKEEIKQLNYPSQLHAEDKSNVFKQLHEIPWGTPYRIGEIFKLTKQHKKFDEITDSNKFNLIYFDAFGARVQPELWTEVIFNKMYNALKPNGVLVTYSAKGSVRRALQDVGFKVEKLPGPPGKREMLRGIKSIKI